MNRVVVTGLGIVSCIGNNQSDVIDSLKTVSYTHLTLPTNREV